MRNDGLQPLVLLALYHLAHLHAPARKSKGVGSDSIRVNLRAGSDGRSDLRSIHRLDIAIGDYPAPNRVRGCGDRVSSSRGDRVLEIISMIILFIATWILVTAASLTVLVAWVAEAIDAVRDGPKKC